MDEDSCWERLTDKIPARVSPSLVWMCLVFIGTALWLGNKFRGQGRGALLTPNPTSGKSKFGSRCSLHECRT